MLFRTHPPLEVVDRFDRYQTVVFIHLFPKGGGLIESLSADEERLIKRPLYLIRYREVNYRWEIERAEMEFLLECDRARVIDAARRAIGIRGGWVRRIADLKHRVMGRGAAEY
jgi:hypothetical protein